VGGMCMQPAGGYFNFWRSAAMHVYANARGAWMVRVQQQ
jgi:hypothetical protein